MTSTRRRVRRLLAHCVPALALLIALAAGVALAADPVPGTAVALEPPAGFTPSTQFPGFQKDGTGASIVINEVPAPVAQLRQAATADGFAGKGMTLLDSSEITISGRPALLLHAAQSAAGNEFEKWMVVFGDDTRAVLLVATFPKPVAAELGEPLKRSLLAAQWLPGRSIGKVEGLPFRVTETRDLKISGRMTNMLMLTRDGVGAPIPPSEPLVVVGTSLGEFAVADVEAFARQRVAQTEQIMGLAHIEGAAVTIDGLPGYELVAEARDTKTGTPIRVYQAVVVEQKRYFLVQGLVGTTNASRFLPQFRELARSLARVR